MILRFIFLLVAAILFVAVALIICASLFHVLAETIENKLEKLEQEKKNKV